MKQITRILIVILVAVVGCVSVRVVTGDGNDTSREDEMRGVSTETNKEKTVKPDTVLLDY